MLETPKARTPFTTKLCSVKISHVTFLTVSAWHLSISGLEIYMHRSSTRAQ